MEWLVCFKGRRGVYRDRNKLLLSLRAKTVVFVESSKKSYILLQNYFERHHGSSRAKNNSSNEIALREKKMRGLKKRVKTEFINQGVLYAHEIIHFGV